MDYMKFSHSYHDRAGCLCHLFDAATLTVLKMSLKKNHQVTNRQSNLMSDSFPLPTSNLMVEVRPW